MSELPERPDGYGPEVEKTYFLARPPTENKKRPPLPPKVRYGIIAAVLVLVLFTAAKLLENPVQSRLENALTGILAENKISLSAERTALSLFPSFHYELHNAVISGDSFRTPTFDEIHLYPSLFGLVVHRLGGSFEIKIHSGLIQGSGSVRGPEIAARLKFSNLDLSASRLLFLITGADASGILNGFINFSGAPIKPETLKGDAGLNFDHLILAEKVSYGVSIPRLTLATAFCSFDLNEGKIQILKFQIGSQEAIKSEQADLYAEITGAIKLGLPLNKSELALITSLGFSKQLLSRYSAIPTALAAGQQGDGSFLYSITGPLDKPSAMAIQK